MRRRPKRSRITIPIRHVFEGEPVPIVADGSVASLGVGEGRHIPLVILDTSHRPDIDTMVQAHSQNMSGDSVCYWTIENRRFALDCPRLILETSKPSKCVIAIEFDMRSNQCFLIDLILMSNGIYIQPGRCGDLLSNTLDNPRILVEVPPNEDFERAFAPLYKRALFQKFRKKGMGRSQSRRSVQMLIMESRKTFDRLSMERNQVGQLRHEERSSCSRLGDPEFAG